MICYWLVIKVAHSITHIQFQGVWHILDKYWVTYPYTNQAYAHTQACTHACTHTQTQCMIVYIKNHMYVCTHT